MVLCVSKRISSAPFSLPAWIKARRSNRTQRGWRRMSQQVCLWSGRDARRPTCPNGGHFVSLNDSWRKGGLFCYRGNRPLTGRLLAWRLDSCQCKPISFLPGERVWAALPEPAGEVAGLIPTGRFTNIQKRFWNFSDVFRIFLIEHSILKIFHKVLKVNTKPYLGFQPVGWASCGSFKKKKKTISPCLKICPSTKSFAVRFWKSSSRNPWKLILKRRKSKLQLGADGWLVGSSAGLQMWPLALHKASLCQRRRPAPSTDAPIQEPLPETAPPPDTGGRRRGPRSGSFLPGSGPIPRTLPVSQDPLTHSLHLTRTASSVRFWSAQNRVIPLTQQIATGPSGGPEPPEPRPLHAYMQIWKVSHEFPVCLHRYHIWFTCTSCEGSHLENVLLHLKIWRWPLWSCENILHCIKW